MKYLKPLISILLIALLAACSNFMGRPDNSQDAGYRVILHKPLTIVPEVARVFLQAGKAFPQNGLDEYEPHCSFEVRKVLPEQLQTIEPDTFKVTRVQRLMEEVVWLRPVQVASLQLTSAAVDSGSSDIFEGYHFWLYSEQQPDVLRMTCRYILTEPWNSRPPTLEEMRFALGDFATISTRGDNLTPGRF